MKTGSEQKVNCHDCGLAVQLTAIQHGHKAVCPRCSANLVRYSSHSIQRSLAFSLTALIFFVCALFFDFLTLEVNGQQRTITVIDSVTNLFQLQFWGLAFVQLVVLVGIPLFLLILLIAVQSCALANFHNAFLSSCFRMLFRLLPWAMAEIFLIAVLVSMIKISELAGVTLGISFWAFVLFTLAMTSAVMYLDHWQLKERLRAAGNQLTSKSSLRKGDLQQRQNVQTTWALLMAAIIFYVPANVLPIMTTEFLGAESPSSILGGVVLLWQHGSYPIALVILIASVFVPVIKLLLLAWLNWSLQRQVTSGLRLRTKAYRFVEFIGRWSMVDVFVVAILVSLIQLDSMHIYPGPAAMSFTLVVILTMLAALNFDARLLWKKTTHE